LVACPVPPTDAGDSIERTISGLVGGLQQSRYGRSLSALIGSGAVDRDGIEWNEIAEGNIQAAGLTDLKPLFQVFFYSLTRGVLISNFQPSWYRGAIASMAHILRVPFSAALGRAWYEQRLFTT